MNSLRWKSPFVMATAAGVAAVGTDFCWLLFDWLVKPANLFSHHYGYASVGVGLITSGVMGYWACRLFEQQGHARTERKNELQHRREVAQVNRYRNFERRVREVTGEETPKRRSTDAMVAAPEPRSPTDYLTDQPLIDTPRRRSEAE